MTRLTKEQFIATRHAPTDAEWAELQALVTDGTIEPLEREQCHVYDGNGLIEQRPDGFYSHAWWYAPNRNETLEEAEEDQYNWYKEFEEDPNKGRKYEIRIDEKQRKQLANALRRMLKSDDVITGECHEALYDMLKKLPDSNELNELNDFTA